MTTAFWKYANSPPAIPAKKLPTMNEVSLAVPGLMPMAAAARSLSRTAMNERPCLLRRILRHSSAISTSTGKMM